MARGPRQSLRFRRHSGAGRRRGPSLQRNLRLRRPPVAPGGQTGGRLRRRQGRIHRSAHLRGVRRLPERSARRTITPHPLTHFFWGAGCLDDIRLEGKHLPLPPAMNGTQWGQATMARNLERNCPSNKPCANVICPEPFECMDLWNDYECT
jgi:hypothetical protein